MQVMPTRKPELDATKVPIAIDIAWSAGIHEGEGTCRLCGRKKNGVAVQVVQKDPEILYRLRDWFGGSVLAMKSGCFTWNVCGDRCRIFVALIYPFLSCRRKMQVDSTGTLKFLQGCSSAGLSMDELKIRLLSFYEEHRQATWRGSLEIRRQRYHERKRTEPAYRERLRKWSQATRDRKRQEKEEPLAVGNKVISIAK